MFASLYMRWFIPHSLKQMRQGGINLQKAEEEANVRISAVNDLKVKIVEEFLHYMTVRVLPDHKLFTQCCSTFIYCVCSFSKERDWAWRKFTCPWSQQVSRRRKPNWSPTAEKDHLNSGRLRSHKFNFFISTPTSSVGRFEEDVFFLWYSKRTPSWTGGRRVCWRRVRSWWEEPVRSVTWGQEKPSYQRFCTRSEKQFVAVYTSR